MVKYRSAWGSKSRWAGRLITGDRWPDTGDDSIHGRELEMKDGRMNAAKIKLKAL